MKKNVYTKERIKNMKIYINLNEYLRNHLEKKENQNNKLETFTNKSIIFISTFNDLLTKTTTFLNKIINSKNEKMKKLDSVSLEDVHLNETNSFIKNIQIQKENIYREINNKLSIEVERLKNEKKIIENENFNLIKHIDQIKIEYDKMLKKFNLIIDELKNKNDHINNLEEYIRLNNNHKYETDDEFDDESRNEYISNSNFNKIDKIIEHNKLFHITKYLTTLDIFNLKHSSKKLFITIESDPIIQRHILFYSLKSKNKKQIDESNLNEELNIFNNGGYAAIDKLINKYNPINESNNSSLRKEFGSIILRGIEYINTDINYFLGREFNPKYTSETKFKENKKNSTNMIESIGGYMNNFVNNILNTPTLDNTNSSDSRSSSTKINSEYKENSLYSYSSIEMVLNILIIGIS